MHDWIDRILARFGYIRATVEQLDAHNLAAQVSDLTSANAELAHTLELAGAALAHALTALRDANHTNLAAALSKDYEEMRDVFKKYKK